jgi:hypothetical protein
LKIIKNGMGEFNYAIRRHLIDKGKIRKFQKYVQYWHIRV